MQPTAKGILDMGQMPETNMLDADALPVALLQLDKALLLKAMNSSAETLLGVSRKAATGRPITDYLFEDCALFDLLSRAKDTQGKVSGHVQLEGPSIMEPLFLHGAVSTHLDGGFGVAFLESARPDITETEPAGLAEFGRILGHEIKNPLAGLSGATQLLLRKARDDQQELLNLILDESARITRLIDKLSAFELFSSPKRKPSNIHKVLEQVLKSESVIFGDSIRFERNFDPSLPDILGDSDHLHEAFQNIIRNGAEAITQTGTGDLVCVTTRFALGHQTFHAAPEASSRFIIITITDNGPGIDIEDQTRIFEIFQTTKTSGSGLGLTVANQVINAHDGHIALECKDEKTAFKIYLPIARQAS